MGAVRGFGRVLRVHVQILEQHRLREGGLVVDSRAPVAVAAGAYLEVERAVHPVDWNVEWNSVNYWPRENMCAMRLRLLVLFRAKNGCQVLGHVGGSAVCELAQGTKMYDCHKDARLVELNFGHLEASSRFLHEKKPRGTKSYIVKNITTVFRQNYVFKAFEFHGFSIHILKYVPLHNFYRLKKINEKCVLD